MTSPGFLDFFLLEASDYIEQIDGLVLRAGAAGPDPEALQRAARTLRGSAKMAKLGGFAELAQALERVGRALRERSVSWDAALSGAVVAAVDDLKLLLRAARNWTAAEDRRAASRVADLARYLPAQPAPGATPARTSGAAFFAAEASNIAAGLELLATRPADRDAAVNVLRRVRALRGVAGIREVPPLPEVMEAAELVGRPLELGEGPLAGDRIQLLRDGAALLRRSAHALREGQLADTPSPERDAFFGAFAAFQDRQREGERIVPIAELFYPEGPQVVRAAPQPPTTPAERFRLEVVSQGEHLRGLVAEAQRAIDVATRERVRRELRQALRAVRADAESFGEHEVADIIAEHAAAAEALDGEALVAIDALAAALASPGPQGEHLAARLAEVRMARATADLPLLEPVEAAPTPAVSAMHASTPSFTSPPTGAPRVGTPRETMAVLDQGIDSLRMLSEQPLSQPVAVETQPLVPIDSLLYRGRAALERAIEIRETIRRQGGTASPEMMDELFDLLELARTE